MILAAALLCAVGAWDVRVGGEIRGRGEGLSNPDFRRDRDDDLAFAGVRSRIDLDAILAEDFDVYLRATDVRLGGDFGRTPGNATTYLERAFLEKRDLFGGRLDLRLGRQPIELADGRIVSTSPWANVPRAFDGIRAEARLGSNLRARVFATEIVEGEIRGGAGVIENRHLLGLVLRPDPARFDHVEIYAISLLDDRGLGAGGRDQEIHSVGAHFDAAFGARWALAFQGNAQFGQNGSNRQRAWLGHVRVLRRIAGRFLRSASLEWNQASGDAAPGDAVTRTWNPVAPSNHERYGFADLVGPRNLREFRLGLRGDIAPRWSWGLDVRRFDRARRADDLYRANGTGRGLAGRGGRGIGSEIDAILRWNPSRRWEIEGGISRLFLDGDAAAAVRAAGGVPGDADFGYLQVRVNF